jgi:hypothetical protein
MEPSVGVGTKHTNMTDKKDTGEKKIKEAFKETHQNVSFSYPDGEQFEHLDIKGYSLNGPYLVIQMKDDTQFIYHMGNVKFIKIWTTKE